MIYEVVTYNEIQSLRSKMIPIEQTGIVFAWSTVKVLILKSKFCFKYILETC